MKTSKEKEFQNLLVFMFLLLGMYLIPVILSGKFIQLNANMNNISAAGSVVSAGSSIITGVFSALLIYLAYTQQIKANKELASQNNNLEEQKQTEFIFSLFNQLDKEIDSVWVKYDFSNNGLYQRSEVYQGPEAMLRITNNLNSYLETGEYQFSGYRTLREIIKVAHSVNAIDLLLIKSNISKEIISVFEQKLKSTYFASLDMPFGKIRKFCEKYPTAIDNEAKLIIKLANKFDPNREVDKFLTEAI